MGFYVADSVTFTRECQGFLLIYSIASRLTFDGISAYHQALLESAAQKGDDKPVFILIGSQSDKGQHERAVSRQEGLAKAKELGCEFIETSAKTALNVERALMTIIRQLRAMKQQKMAEAARAQPQKKWWKRKRSNCLVM